MSDDHIDDQQTPPDKVQGAAPSTPDERDATIARLERAVADERKNSAMLRDTNEGLRFKTEVLEKSYSKQLADARLRSDTAERELAEQKGRLAALGSGGEDTIRLLNEMRAELERVIADRDRLRNQLARNGGSEIKTIAPNNAEPQPQDGSLTINELIANSSWVRERHPAEGGHLNEQVRTDQESPPEEMIAPELVFTRGSGKDDES